MNISGHAETGKGLIFYSSVELFRIKNSGAHKLKSIPFVPVHFGQVKRHCSDCSLANLTVAKLSSFGEGTLEHGRLRPWQPLFPIPPCLRVSRHGYPWQRHTYVQTRVAKMARWHHMQCCICSWTERMVFHQQIWMAYLIPMWLHRSMIWMWMCEVGPRITRWHRDGVNRFISVSIDLKVSR